MRGEAPTFSLTGANFFYGESAAAGAPSPEIQSGGFRERERERMGRGECVSKGKFLIFQAFCQIWKILSKMNFRGKNQTAS